MIRQAGRQADRQTDWLAGWLTDSLTDSDMVIGNRDGSTWKTFTGLYIVSEDFDTAAVGLASSFFSRETTEIFFKTKVENMPFPLAKLGYLLLRQLGKHVAIALKARTAKSPRFKSMCHGLANCK